MNKPPSQSCCLCPPPPTPQTLRHTDTKQVYPEFVVWYRLDSEEDSEDEADRFEEEEYSEEEEEEEEEALEAALLGIEATTALAVVAIHMLSARRSLFY